LEVAKALGVTANLPSAAANGEPLPSAKSAHPNRIATLDEAMKQHIELALTLAHGRIEGRRGAAALLQINPHTLRARMRKLGIDWTQFRRQEEEMLV
jgi:transcriptional regulator with GAF, ATPase, and Fis domain